MYRLDQTKVPVCDALRRVRDSGMVHFDVPGHKGGRGNKALRDFFGSDCIRSDMNSMKALDNLCHPVSVIREAEELAADAFGAAHAFLMVGGASSCVEAMVMTACKAGEKIIMPRNVHRSAINALVICGAVPVYVDPGVNRRLGIPLGMSVEGVKKAIEENPDAKAVLVNNPTYYGVCSDLPAIIKLAHEHGMLVLCDEAHGTHFYFSDLLPPGGMQLGADMAACSMHKTGGSFTQSAFLLCGEGVNPGYVRQIINLTQTTSGSYLLLCSLDMARRNLALNGAAMMERTIEQADYAREEINALGGYYAFGSEIVDGEYCCAFDVTKLSVHTRDIGLAGVEVYDLLRDEYDIQLEFGDIGNFLAIVTAGDRDLEIERLISALSEIKRLYSGDLTGMLDHEYINPLVEMTPQAAFYSEKVSLPIEESAGRISTESVMCYPPGIPILAPGERITKEILQYIAYAKEKGCFMTGTEDMDISRINVVR
ncbi:MAG TPA: aminotransferase class I/II-fold pyridoxal phosphate-dependent enzyme [Candidatus Faecivivens stercoripullorum]|uniref:Aminotransferase class I/II-fold pyridoxal phosphate-dependent enzyme n=1 Tax=Candidatus Faecivivens stercoripullorum TaxID=2840805 RepID=A0A9D1KSF9_9FIRM|nr:aminotransferase class I/II-fold pyridoxal phosphate-dependent enzyme [Candidatus Faecivivens stercoripullorum]